MRIPSGDALDDVLTDLKFSGVAWTSDNTGVFYSVSFLAINKDNVCYLLLDNFQRHVNDDNLS